MLLSGLLLPLVWIDELAGCLAWLANPFLSGAWVFISRGSGRPLRPASLSLGLCLFFAFAPKSPDLVRWVVGEVSLGPGCWMWSLSPALLLAGELWGTDAPSALWDRMREGLWGFFTPEDPGEKRGEATGLVGPSVPAGYVGAMGVVFFGLAVLGYLLAEAILMWVAPHVFWWLSYIPGFLFVKSLSLGRVRVRSLDATEKLEMRGEKEKVLRREDGRWVLSAQACWFAGFFLWSLVIAAAVSLTRN